MRRVQGGGDCVVVSVRCFFEAQIMLGWTVRVLLSPTFVTLLGKVDEPDQRSRERTRFRENA